MSKARGGLLGHERRIDVHGTSRDGQGAMRRIQDVSYGTHTAPTAGAGAAAPTHLAHGTRPFGGVAENLTIADLMAVADEHGRKRRLESAPGRPSLGKAGCELLKGCSTLKSTFNIVVKKEVISWKVLGNSAKRWRVTDPGQETLQGPFNKLTSPRICVWPV